MNIEEDGKTYIKIKDRQEKSIIERNKVLEKLSKLEPLKKEDLKTAGKTYDELNDMVVRLRTDNFILQQENKQLKEKLENKIDLYEDTISYQLGFDKGKEYLQQIIDNALEYIKQDNINVEEEKWVKSEILKKYRYSVKSKLLKILGDKENEENIK